MQSQSTKGKAAVPDNLTEVTGKLDAIAARLSDLLKRVERAEAARAAPRPGGAALDRQLAMLEALRAQKAALESPRSLTLEEENKNSEIQARADSVYQHVGRRAPPPGPYERPFAYRRRLLSELTRYSSDPRFKDVKWSIIPEDGLSQFEGKIFEDILSRPDAVLADVPDDRLVAVEEVDPRTGQKYIHYKGRSTFIKHMAPPARVVSPVMV